MLYVVWTISRMYVCRTLYSKYSTVGVNLVSHQLDRVQTLLSRLITLTKEQPHVADLEEIRVRTLQPKVSYHQPKTNRAKP